MRASNDAAVSIALPKIPYGSVAAASACALRRDYRTLADLSELISANTVSNFLVVFLAKRTWMPRILLWSRFDALVMRNSGYSWTLELDRS